MATGFHRQSAQAGELRKGLEAGLRERLSDAEPGHVSALEILPGRKMLDSEISRTLPIRRAWLILFR
jgi:hypothetical protein